MRLLGIRVIRFEPKIKGEQLTLRLLRIRDLFILRSTFRPELPPEIGGAALEFFGFLASLWRWLRSTFQVLYVIERKRADEHSIVGFIGLYDLDMGRRASLSTVLFDPKDRRQGYGRESVHLLLDFLEKAGVAKRVYVEVLKGNLPSLTFFQNMGFKIQTGHSDCLLMAKKLDKDNAAPEVKGRFSIRIDEKGTG
jgi:diamine N-acetyltransferase